MTGREAARLMRQLDAQYREELIAAADNCHDLRPVLNFKRKQRELAASYRKGKKPTGRA